MRRKWDETEMEMKINENEKDNEKEKKRKKNKSQSIKMVRIPHSVVGAILTRSINA